jgi:hypothetical protein
MHLELLKQFKHNSRKVTTISSSIKESKEYLNLCINGDFKFIPLLLKYSIITLINYDKQLTLNQREELTKLADYFSLIRYNNNEEVIDENTSVHKKLCLLVTNFVKTINK